MISFRCFSYFRKTYRLDSLYENELKVLVEQFQNTFRKSPIHTNPESRFAGNNVRYYKWILENLSPDAFEFYSAPGMDAGYTDLHLRIIDEQSAVLFQLKWL